MAGDASLIADAIDASGIRARFVLAINDAELAALDALAEPALKSSAKTLVITLGFGLGAALATCKRDPSRA
jgi:predicted NBD/HSP70 family sugar kinase